MLLITGEDLNPESLFAVNARIRGVVAACKLETWPRGDAACTFVVEAARDAASRAGMAFGCPFEVIGTLDAAKIAAAARAAGVSDIITPYAPVGPVADALAELARVLKAEGLTMTLKRRSWDGRFWPHASKGYFKLREQISDVLAEEGLRM